MAADNCARCGAPMLYGLTTLKGAQETHCPRCSAKERRSQLLSAALRVTLTARRIERQDGGPTDAVEELLELGAELRELAGPRPRRRDRRRRR